MSSCNWPKGILAIEHFILAYKYYYLLYINISKSIYDKRLHTLEGIFSSAHLYMDRVWENLSTLAFSKMSWELIGHSCHPPLKDKSMNWNVFTLTILSNCDLGFQLIEEDTVILFIDCHRRWVSLKNILHHSGESSALKLYCKKSTSIGTILGSICRIFNTFMTANWLRYYQMYRILVI